MKQPLVLAGLAWSVLVAIAAAISMAASHESMIEQARVAARVAFEKDLVFRRWATQRGGVYVEVGPENRPNPYLTVPERDLVTTTGKRLTLINPAYMMRQVYELQSHAAQVLGHITSLDPLRPGNMADGWETEALRSFETGEVDEHFAITGADGREQLRIIRPMRVEEPCLKCHAGQGYAVGEIRGGISVSVPLANHLREFRTEATKTATGYAIVWAIGLTGIIFGGRRLTRSIATEHQARLEAEAATIAKGEFLANMSHEIRTPLNGVMGMLQLLRETSSPQEQAEYLDMAYESGNRLLHLLNDILDFSRVEAGKIELERQPYAPIELLQSVADVFRPSCEKIGLELRLEPDPSMPACLLGDEARLRQVLFNLVGNAVKFTPGGTVTLSAWAAPCNAKECGGHPGRVRLYLSIADTGIGIPGDKLMHVFERFTQVDGSYTRRYQGAGLGLAIVRRLVDLMGGGIEVESEPGHGTTFTLRVPQDLPQEPEQTCQAPHSGDGEPKAAGRQQETASPDPNPRGQRLLLVEDEEVSRLSAQVMLKRMGYEVATAPNGLAAVEAFRNGRFSCVLMDIQMPLMNGVEATRAIRELERTEGRRRTRIVALTAYAMPGDREHFLASGMDDYVTKPVQPEALLLALRKAAPRREEASPQSCA